MPRVKTFRSSPGFLGSALCTDKKKQYCLKPSSESPRSTPKQIVLNAEMGRLKVTVVVVRLVISNGFTYMVPRL